jgi:hypothetical protein
VEVHYRVNGGLTAIAAADPVRHTRKAQYFRARLPALRAGDIVEYLPICRCAGRQVPSPDQARQFASSFRVTDAQAKSPQGLRLSASDAGDAGARRHEVLGSDMPIATQPLSQHEAHKATLGAVLATSPTLANAPTVDPGLVRAVTPHPFQPPPDEDDDDDGGGGPPPHLPNSPPSLTIDQAAYEVTRPAPPYTVTIKGTASDIIFIDGEEESSLGGVEWRLGSSGPFQPASGTYQHVTYNWDATVTLPSQLGAYTVEVRAWDTAGKVTSRNVTVNVVDITGPTLTIITPFEGDEFPLVGNTVEVEFKGIAIDSQTGVSKVEWALDGQTAFQLATPEEPDWSTWSAKIKIGPPLGEHIVTFRAYDTLNHSTLQLRRITLLQAGVPKDPLAVFGRGKYLMDLLALAVDRLRTSTGSPVTMPDLTTIFYQPFKALTEANKRLVANQSVSQVRICIEVLRQYFARNNRGIPAPAEARYHQAAYETLLRQLGTSYDEMRLARVADDATRAALASRLGIEASPINLDQLFFLSNQVTEADLEDRFGLVQTTRDPLTTDAIPVAKLRRWRQEHLRALWQQQDDAAQSVFGTPMPVIDPDIVGAGDFTNPTPANAVYALWQTRQQQVANLLATIKATGQAQTTPLAGFERIVSDTLGPIADLVALEDEHKSGNDITSALLAMQLTLQPFLHLMRIRKLVQDGSVSDAEWDDVYAILVQVQKVRQYATWRPQEGTLVLGPEHFRLPDATQSPPALPAWRATLQARQAWQETLHARLQQEQVTAEALQAAIEATEAAVLPALRDALLEDLVRTGEPTLDTPEEVANRLSQELAIDCKSSGSQRTTRLEQAIETIQGVLFATRMGRFPTTPVLDTVNPSNPSASWKLTNSLPTGQTTSIAYGKDQFDLEWQWFGAFSTWRAARFVFGYPENYLLPSLRPPQGTNRLEGPSQAFAGPDGLVKHLRETSRLTPASALRLAAEYHSALKTEPGASLPSNLQDEQVILADQLTDIQLDARRGLSASFFNSLNPPNPHKVKNFVKEIFYFVPMALALQLQKSGQYLTALNWFRSVYAYDLKNDVRKIYYGLALETAANVESDDFIAASDWLLEGFNPHEIVTRRPDAYTSFTLMSIIRCLLDFADAEFTRSTSESLPRARAMYVTALDLLRQPELQRPGDTPFPPNPVVQALQLHTEMNLYKLRNGRNIAGLERQPAPEELPASLLNSSGQLRRSAAIALRPTPYRYAVLMERAKQLVTIAQQIEASFLSALERHDAEAYSLLKARQDQQLSRAGLALQDLRVTEAAHGWTLAALQRARAVIQAEHFQGLLDEGWIGLEKTAMYFMAGAAALHTAAATMSGIGAFFSNPFARAKDTLSEFAAAASTTASILQTWASYERRKEEWRFQKTLADQDIAIGDQQMTLAVDRQYIVEQERVVANMQVEHADFTMGFLANKFTNADLFEWMSGVLERVYAYFLQQATAMAQLAQNQLAFERQETPPEFIQADYWQTHSETYAGTDPATAAPDRRGLTGSVRLLQDMYKLDQYAFETNKRKLQLSQTFSLAHLAPAEFQRFRETGRLLFATPMDLFDRDFPGHYLRLMKRVRISVPALISPVHGIRATLTASGLSRVVTGGEVFQTIVVRRDPELIAFTSPSNGTGLIELEPEGEMLLPFESMGVDTMWELQMPKAANPFDYRTIADVVFTVEYTALHSFDYRQQVIKQLSDRLSAERPLSLRDQFADQWYALHNPRQTTTPLVVTFKTARTDFPPNVEELRIQQVLLAFVRAEGQSFEVASAQLRFTPQGETLAVGGAAGSSVDGIISTRRGNAGSWTAMIKKAPVGTWELALPNTEEMKNRFKNEEIDDILLVLTYAGRTPAWPA